MGVRLLEPNVSQTMSTLATVRENPSRQICKLQTPRLLVGIKLAKY